MPTIPTYETTLKLSNAEVTSGETVQNGVVVGPPIVYPEVKATDLPPWTPFNSKLLDPEFNPNPATSIPRGFGGGGAVGGTVPAGPGADPKATHPVAAKAQMSNNQKADLRVTIRVPNGYQNKAFESGIIFPYTPQITLEHKADFTPQNPLHTNYTLNFYKSSSVSDISIQGLFTVQNDNDAIQYLAAVHLLRALTKGRFGGTDQFRGSAPPICRLMAYGDYMLNNVPVSIASFKQDLPSDVDYYYLASSSLGSAMVPTKCTISVVCKLMVSRSEMLTASVDSWLSGVSRKAGLL